MATTEAQRSAIFNKLCDETDQKVRELHRGSPTGQFNLNALQGWLLNQWNRKTTLQDVGTNVARGAVRVVAYFLSVVPVLGSLYTMACDEAIALMRRKYNEQEVKHGREPEVTGIFLVEHGMQAYVDALRKASQAETDYISHNSVGSCRDLTDNVGRFYYWKYRLERLAYYHAIIDQYSKHVGQVLAGAEANCKAAEAHMKANAPKIYEDWTWHRSQCKGFCTFPAETLEISAPTFLGNTPTYIAGPDAGKPVKISPTSGKNVLPLPPRPPNLYKK